MSNDLFNRALTHFYHISTIPRGSGNEEAIAAYLEAFAGDHGLFCRRDAQNNVFIRREADEKYSQALPVVLQGHTDMVCEKAAGATHDFTTDPIRILREGDILRADGTTLGADNGVAVALMLALLETENLTTPTLECIFTTSEETGMDGMRHFDASIIKGRRMINLDSAGEGEATAACAGGVRTDLTKIVAREPVPAGYATLSVSITGLAGGHSGEDIDKGRLSANCAMATLLSHVDTGMCLSAINGGSKDNAISRDCTAVVAVADAEAFREAIAKTESHLRAGLVPEDAGFAVNVTTCTCGDVMNSMDTRVVLNLLRLLPVGVRHMSRDIPGLVETSANLGVVKTVADRVELTVSSRSSVEWRLDEMMSLLEGCALLAGADFHHRSRYPGWAFTTGSTLQQCYLDTCKQLYDWDGKIIGIHAGLECGLFMEKIPDMDIISIGPDIRDLHSPEERMTVSSYERFCGLVEAMLAAMV